ncbi:hypothetical protein [Haladaptatus sp. CMSO5]|uniref:hypothetical protein n=1 Tax=Haladaptatus sp. CMSO5 TaxID=3120514 RepID=UPI002FCE0933
MTTQTPLPTVTRRRILRTTALLSASLALSAGSAAANPGKPNFGPSLYGDGKTWGTKGAAAIPGPNGKNDHSFDKLFAFTNGATGQLPVAEAAPGNPAFNGGRWYTHTATWTAAGLAAHNPLPVLTSSDDVHAEYEAGHLSITPGSPNPGDPPNFFECPLLPVKQ